MSKRVSLFFGTPSPSMLYVRPKRVCVIERQCVYSYSYLYYLHERKLCRCARTRILPPSSRPGTRPLVMLLYGFFWRSTRNHYLFVLAMRALVMSIHVRTYLPKFNNEMHYYYDIIPTAVPWGFFLQQIVFVSGQIIWKYYLAQSYFISLSIYQHLKSNSRVPFKRQNFCALLACLAQPPSAFTSRCATKKKAEGEGRLSRPLKTALERSDSTEKFPFQESHTEAGTKKTPDQIPVP